MSNLRMLRDRILVLPIERKLSSIIEVKNTEKFNLGTVIACGPGKEYNGKIHPMDVKVGDTVRYGEFDFPWYENGGVRYQIVTEADIAAVVEGDLLRPLHDRIIVLRLEQERTTSFGIIIPDSDSEKPDRGEVIAVGNGLICDDGKVLPVDVKPGQVILFGKHTGQSMKVSGIDYLVMTSGDLAAIVEPEPFGESNGLLTMRESTKALLKAIQSQEAA